MESGLVLITVLASLVAIGASLFAWRARVEEKQRSRARVAALTAAAGIAREPVVPVSSLSGFESEKSSAAEPVLHREFLGSSTATSTGTLQRGLAAAAVVFALGLVVFGIVRMTGERSPATAPAAPLELLSLRHERLGPRLSVAGLVRNPGSGAGIGRLDAVVLLFDEQGTFVTSARAPVEFTRLGAGDESPFVISLDAPQSVARYRVSFRSDDRTVPHVDRRGETAAAAPVSQAGRP
jgi:hypothetical protein